MMVYNPSFDLSILDLIARLETIPDPTGRIRVLAGLWPQINLPIDEELGARIVELLNGAVLERYAHYDDEPIEPINMSVRLSDIIAELGLPVLTLGNAATPSDVVRAAIDGFTSDAELGWMMSSGGSCSTLLMKEVINANSLSGDSAHFDSDSQYVILRFSASADLRSANKPHEVVIFCSIRLRLAVSSESGANLDDRPNPDLIVYGVSLFPIFDFDATSSLPPLLLHLIQDMLPYPRSVTVELDMNGGLISYEL